MTRTARIGGACGFWGESPMATPQLLADGPIDYLVYDYLAEISLSIMARARAADSQLGYATDFVSDVLAPNLETIARQRTRLLANAGGVNVQACAAAIRRLIDEAGLDLRVATVEGDDLMALKNAFAADGILEMFSGAAFPDPGRVASINAYLGAAPMAAALRRGADIVITGRCADSALTLAACLHAFDWSASDWDRLAAGSLAGHLIECGPQATGGNYTDWREVAGTIEDIGYPIVEMQADGVFVLTKPAGSGGKVGVGTVAEQMLYEIEDPQAYVLPDVVADFSRVRLDEIGPDRVQVSGARGYPATDTHKISVTYADGYRVGMMLSFTGYEAEAKARRYADTALHRARAGLQRMSAPDFRQVSVEVLGAEDQYGAYRRQTDTREVVLKVAAWHADASGCHLLIKSLTGLALATPPGLAVFNAGRPRPSPVVRLFSFLLPKTRVSAHVALDGHPQPVETITGQPFDSASLDRPVPPVTAAGTGGQTAQMTEVPLIELARARSGDKGDRANIGVIARRPEYLPWLWAALTEARVAARFQHFLEGEITRYLLPGCDAINLVLDRVLGGGGVASLRNDPQGKAYAQLLLAMPVPVPAGLVQPSREPAADQ
jgi:hypothetical protein